MNKNIDDGPIIYQKKIKVDNLTLEGLINKTKKQSFICLIEVLKKYLNNKIRVINKNQKKDSSYYSFPSKNDVILFKKNSLLY